MHDTPDINVDNINDTPKYINTTVNQTFNHFLQLEPFDQDLLRHYHSVLIADGDIFAKKFYAYLMASPITAKVIEEYQAQGGLIDDLVKKQLDHLFGFLSGNIDESSAQRMIFIGEVHQRHNIQPVWVMGAYKLYLDHLQQRIRNHKTIQDEDRSLLEDIVIKLLFRDMGLMLEGYWSANLQTISKEKENVTALRDQMSSLLANIPHLLWSIDITNNLPLYVSPHATEICDMDLDMPIPCLGWTHAEDRENVVQAWNKALLGQIIEVESRVNKPNGEQRWFRRLFYPYKNTAGEVIRIDGLMEDTTDGKATLERLNTLATTDSLTGLINRTLFHDRLAQAIVSSNRIGNHQVAVILMDLNNFKEINDTLGHPAGDSVLIEVSQRLQSVLRTTDSLARLGGDEFSILLPQIMNGPHDIKILAQRIQDTFVKPFNIDDNELFLGASIGIALYPEHGEDVATLMSRADVAMYSTKNTEKNYQFYTTDLDPNAQKHLQLSGDLRHALIRNELVLYYQPKVDLKSNRVIGAEALIRWQHPVQGLLQPDEFIHLAERSGLIVPITNWVIKTATTQNKAWANAGYNLKIAINVSARSFHQSGELVSNINKVLSSLGMPATSLEVEITENVLMSDIGRIFKQLKQISDLNISIAIDDFGTGYSSLTYLKTLPINALKIDKSFIAEMENDENDIVIVRSTIDLAHNLGLSVIAEGIENQAALDLLIKLGCDGAQGYHFSRPLPPDQFIDWIDQAVL